MSFFWDRPFVGFKVVIDDDVDSIRALSLIFGPEPYS